MFTFLCGQSSSFIDTYGCTNPEACNYNFEATEDDGSCSYYLDACGICGGDNTCNGTMIDNDNNSFNETCLSTDYSGSDFDCNGVCFGSLEYDGCGVCGGNGILEACHCEDTSSLNEDGCCDEITIDCLDVCGGDAIVDDCGICGGENASLDCNDVCDGGAIEDCSGICNGPTEPDDCGVCGGNNYFQNGLLPNGSCNCNGGYLDCNNECTCMINDQSHSSCNVVLDDCGFCGGNNFFGSIGCTQIETDDGIVEQCLIMDGEHANQCSCEGAWNNSPEFLGCDGVCSSSPAVIDICGECGGEGQITNNCGCEQIFLDGNNIGDICACDWELGNPNIDYIYIDECGVCGGDGIPIDDCGCNGEMIDACFNCTASPCIIDNEIPVGLSNDYLSSDIRVPLLLSGYENLQAIDMELYYDNQILQFVGITFENTIDEDLKNFVFNGSDSTGVPIASNVDLYNSSVTISMFQQQFEETDGSDEISIDYSPGDDIFLYFIFNLTEIDENLHGLTSSLYFNQFKVNNVDFNNSSNIGDISIDIVACLDNNADNPNIEAIEVVDNFGSLVINGFCEYTVLAEVNEWGMISDSIVVSSSENDFEMDISLGTQLLINGEPIDGEVEITVSGGQASDEVQDLLPEGLDISGEITSMEPIGLTLDPPANLDIGYNVDDNRYQNNSFSIYTLSSVDSGEWVEIESLCTLGLCSADINTFAMYAVLEIIKGCMDVNAFNYNSDAVEDDGSCIYAGCTDEEASNFNFNASIDYGSCIYEQGCYTNDYFYSIGYQSFTNDCEFSECMIDGWSEIKCEPPCQFYVDEEECMYKQCTTDGFLSEVIIDTSNVDCEHLNTTLISNNILFSTYPNPFNSTLHLNFKIDYYQDIKVVAYNISGEIIDVIYEGYANPGSQLIKWDANNFPSGVYLISISGKTWSKMKKVVYLK